MRSLFLVVALISMCLVAKANVVACYVVAESYPTAYENARAVFIGEVVKIEPLTSYLKGELEIMRYGVTFKVEYSWKGAGFREIGLPEIVVLSEQVLKAPEGLEGCFRDVTFSEGKKYLVYANESKDKSLTVELGNASKPLWNATEDLKELRKQEAYFQSRSGRNIFLKPFSLRL